MKNSMAKGKTYINEMTVKCIQTVIDSNDFEMSPVELTDIARLKIDKIEIRYSAHNFIMQYEPEVDKLYYDAWLKDVGGVVRKDFRNDDIDSYFVIKTYGSKTLAKKLDSVSDADIVLRFGASKLLTIGDFQYLPIKTVESDKSFIYSSYVYNNFIDSEDNQKLDKESNMDSDIEFEDYEDNYSQEDMDLMNYYTPENE